MLLCPARRYAEAAALPRLTLLLVQVVLAAACAICV